ncbi:NTPase [Campylobacter insulaenigrae]|uniref:NTPase n=1 Tax=Campylobacter insulaenigrae TaxID=260714 RepID=UPI002152435E|nr:NTPase [Campylobacter insulaenigrae]MCR6580380.1 NTPase [Campylobacter insulaenigrae]
MKNYKIKVTSTERLDDQYKDVIDVGTYEDEDIDKFFNTMKTFDIAESLIKKDFSNQYIDFEIITDKEKIPLSIRLGDKNFQQGIDHLIKIGSSKISKDIDPETKKELDAHFQKYKNTKYDQMLDGTFKALKNLSEISNKDIAMMILEFSDSYSKSREKYKEKKINKDTNISKDPHFFQGKIADFFKKKLNKKEFDKEISSEKTFSINR